MRLRIYVYDHTCDCEEFAEFSQWSRAYEDIVGGNSRTIGYYTEVVKGGDKTFGKYNGKSKTEMKKDGSWEMVFSGEWENTGGTGKLERVKGKGTHSGKASPASFSCDGVAWRNSSGNLQKKSQPSIGPSIATIPS